MKLLGFGREATMMLSEFEAQFREDDEAEALIDIAKVYEQQSRKADLDTEGTPRKIW